MRSVQTAAPGVESEYRPGRCDRPARARDRRPSSPQAIPVEVGIPVLDPDEPAGQALEPGGTATPTPSATPSASPAPRRATGGGGSGLALVIPGVAGLAIGAVGGFPPCGGGAE